MLNAKKQNAKTDTNSRKQKYKMLMQGQKNSRKQKTYRKSQRTIKQHANTTHDQATRTHTPECKKAECKNRHKQ